MSRIYYGWRLVTYAVACQMLVIGASQTAFGLYVVPVSREFGLSRADMNTAIILMNIGAAVIAPLVGWLADRVPLRPIFIAGAVFTGLSFAGLGFSHSVLLSAALMLVMTAGEGASGRTGAVLIVRWFGANRGRALTVGAMGLSLASILVAPGIGWLIGNVGWRTTLWISGGVASAVVLLPALFLRMAPSADEREREGVSQPLASPGSTPEKPLSVGAVLQMPQFWCIGLAVAIPMSVSQAVVISMTPMAVEAGIPVAQAATLVSAAGVMAISSKLGLALLADRVNQMLLLGSVFCLAAVENVLLFAVAGHTSYLLLLGCAVMQGLTSGMLMPLFIALLARRFGPTSFGTILGLMFPIISLMNALFARFAGEVFDRTGGYRLAFATFVGMELLAAALIFSVSRFPSPVGASGRHPSSRDLPAPGATLPSEG